MPLSKIRNIFEIEYLKPQKIQNKNGSHLFDTNLSFNGFETQHSTHALHPYVAAINPPLVNALIKTYIPKGENVLDPYCGGGGVLVECVLADRPCAGGEINPLGVFISKAKTTYVARELIEQTLDKILKLAKELKSKIPINSDKHLSFWYREEDLLDLTALSKATEEIAYKDVLLKPLFQTILSATARDVMLTYRGEVRLRKLQGKDLERFKPNTLEVFNKRARLTIDRVSNLPKNAKSDVALRDIRNLPFKDNEFYGIICSPPYADDKNGVGYFQFSKNMLLLLGFTKEEINKNKELFHGSMKEGKKPPKSLSLSQSLDNVERNNKVKYKEAVAFYCDYADGLKEMVRVTRGKIIIVVGNRVLARTAFDNTAITVDIFNNLGIKLEHHYTRELKKKRIPNLGGDGGGISLEHILVFSK